MANPPVDLYGSRFPEWTRGTRQRRSWRYVVPLALAVALFVLAAPPPAQAQPDLSEIEADIDEAWRELEPLIEDYNRVREELKDNREVSEELAEDIEPLELQASIAEAEIADIAVQQYKSGPVSAFGALVSSGSPTTFVNRLSALDQIARNQSQRIEDANGTLAEYEAEKAEIDALIEEQVQQEEEIAERRAEIEEDIEELEAMRQDALAAGAPTTTGDTAPSGSCPAVEASGPGAVAAEFACAQIGLPYQFGSAGPNSYDCSGLTQQAWASAGVSLSHHTGAQWNEGQVVDRSNLLPGDLVFFYNDLSHVGLYVGNGMMVDAPQTGSTVGMRTIDTMPIAGYRRPG